MEFNPNLGFVAGFLIILSYAFPQLRGRSSHHRIGVRVVVRSPPENFNANDPLLEKRRVSFERVLDNILKESGTSPAAAEQGMEQHPLHLFPDGSALGVGKVWRARIDMFFCFLPQHKTRLRNAEIPSGNGNIHDSTLEHKP
jgi:hypothetical protein